MKIVFSILGLVVLLGVLYGLAFVGVIPAQKMADKNPSLAKILYKMHLAKAKPKAALKLAAQPKADPKQQQIQAEQAQVAADRAQLEKDKAAFEAQKQQAAAPAPSNSTAAPSIADTNAKLSAIYATMSPDDIAKIFEKLSDAEVVQNLMPLDEKKAGKILAAMPADRAARLTRQMMASPTPQQTAAVPPQPAISIP